MTKTLLPVLFLASTACNATLLSQWEKDVQAGTSAVVPAEQLACTIATDVDPTGGTAICQEMDEAGNLIGPVFNVVEDVTSIAALAKKTPTAMQDAVRANRKAKAK